MIQFLRVTFLGAALALPVAAIAQGSPPSSHTVKRGETLMTIARELRYSNVTLNQMALAMAQANISAFRARSVDRLYVGTKLRIPEPATVAAIPAETADREVARLLKAERRYKDAVALERSGDHKGAFDAYMDAGKMGHALAELRLGELYDKGTPALPRDAQQSAQWYQKARAQGVTIEKTEGRRMIGGPALR